MHEKRLQKREEKIAGVKCVGALLEEKIKNKQDKKQKQKNRCIPMGRRADNEQARVERTPASHEEEEQALLHMHLLFSFVGS
jgi:hypothetical protein